jgi:hypothetical protein
MSRAVAGYWREILTFSVIFGAYLICAAPDASWQLLMGDDMGDIMLGASYFRPIHFPGFPWVAGLGWLAVHMPGNDFWNMAVFSSLCFTAASLFIFLIVRQSTVNKWAPYVASLTFAAAPVVFTGAISSKGSEYGIAVLAVVALFYFIKTDRKWAAAVVAAVGLGTHPVTIPFVLSMVLLYLRQPKYLGVVALGLLPYLYIPLTVRPPYGQANPNGFTWDINQITITSHLFGLRGVHLLQRLGIMALIVLGGTGLGLFALFRMRWDKDAIILGGYALAVLAYCMTTSYTPHLIYMGIALAPVAILVGKNFERVKNIIPHAFVILPLILMAVNIQLYDIGRTLDPQPTQARQFLDELEVLPEGTTVVANHCHAFTLINYYECGENPNNIAVTSKWCLGVRAVKGADLEAIGFVVPDKVFELLGNRNARDTEEAWRIFREANIGKPIYWTTYDGETPLSYELVPVGASGMPSGSDDYGGYSE